MALGAVEQEPGDRLPGDERVLVRHLWWGVQVVMVFVEGVGSCRNDSQLDCLVSVVGCSEDERRTEIAGGSKGRYRRQRYVVHHQ